MSVFLSSSSSVSTSAFSHQPVQENLDKTQSGRPKSLKSPPPPLLASVLAYLCCSAVGGLAAVLILEFIHVDFLLLSHFCDFSVSGLSFLNTRAILIANGLFWTVISDVVVIL